MNYCAVWSCLIMLLIGLFEIINNIANGKINTFANLLIAFKLIMFFNLNALSYVGCLYFNYNDDIEFK